MRKSKFSENQIVAILKEADSGIPVAEVLRNCVFHGIVNSISPKRDRGFTKA